MSVEEIVVLVKEYGSPAAAWAHDGTVAIMLTYAVALPGLCKLQENRIGYKSARRILMPSGDGPPSSGARSSRFKEMVSH